MSRPQRERIFSGQRPTGPLHVGHLIGALQSWVRLQDEYECFWGIVDWHMLTTHYEDTHELDDNIIDMAATWLGCGIDPERSTILIQSQVKQHAELALLLGMVSPLGELMRLSTYKDQLENLKDKNINTYGFLGYPVLQTADIAAYRATRVPVGEDQVEHIEKAREFVRKFNNLYGRGKQPLLEPQAMLSPTPRLLGVDGRKMSKSYDNAINLSDSPKTILKKVNTMVTDPQRVRRNDPGDPEVCSVFAYHRIFTPEEDVEQIAQDCRTAAIGCGDCKRRCAERLNALVAPTREGRARWLERRSDIEEILAAGNAHAREVTEETLQGVREAVGLR
ncbi:tryptophan--tRNA ligase [Candidatus Sumerlaeota bacterium]|nr:tryptophan--tRNA ligase [Candidatus Sumerlaeota bacterium]